jgi:L-Ala-D/L-Glu epimerase / N-acetyl-D-glutamate racemase
MNEAVRRMSVEHQIWPVKGEFRISRGSRKETHVILIKIIEAGVEGIGESVPTAHYNETIESVMTQIDAIRPNIEGGLSLHALNRLLPPGAARNALDCALWDLKAKQMNTRVEKLLGFPQIDSIISAQTLSLNDPINMIRSAANIKDYPLIKIKFDNHNVVEKIQGIARSAPKSRIIVDANESWNITELNYFEPELKDNNVVLIEQPLPARDDADLLQYTGSIPICADESFHSSEDLERVSNYYQCVNIKLDKAGGLTEAVKILQQAKMRELKVMLGCMVGTSFSMAPSSLLASQVDFVDLDGPTFLCNDRQFGFEYTHGRISKLDPRLWGGWPRENQANRSFRMFHHG